MPRAPWETNNRSLLALAATGVAVGIGISVVGNPGFGAWLTIAALALLVFALHRLGRSGPDSPIHLDAADNGDDRS